MASIFESKTLGPTERIIMLALADHADDSGRCFPSMSRLAQRTGLSERAVRTNVRKLEIEGYLSVIIGAGMSGANVYFVKPTPAADAPRQEMPPGISCPEGGHMTTVRGAAGAPKPSLTINEPPENTPIAPKDDDPAKAKKTKLPELWTPSDTDIASVHSLQIHPDDIKEIANDFYEYWAERTDAGGKKTPRGWSQAWRNRCRDIAPQFARNRRMAGKPSPNGYGQGSSIASIVARRWASDQV